MDNTLRHGEKATGVSVLCRNSDLDDSLIITWKDDGVGVLEESKEMIFKRSCGKNTGFGLFLSREILSLTGIEIRENGIPGEGASFEITVPESSWQKVRADS
jgi:signal transduction histidine kinase